MERVLSPQTSLIDRLRMVCTSHLGAPLLLLAILAMVVIPLPPVMLDLLFSFNIALSIVILLAVIYVARPLDFSVFPTVLLLTTLLRLSLNIASTRVVLLEGHTGPDAAGRVIQAFGEFVIGGNYFVGFVVFMILTLINFVVVTKGAGRISEVSARFILDAMPGRQMAIDADLNGGVITREEAKAKREEVRQEADFYGSMDGASKFVRGDAIAGLLILFVNVIGGLAVGAVQHEMSIGDAARSYILLTIGDGLVAQLPALLLSTGVAVLVTRMSQAQDMGKQVATQMLGQPKALAVTAGLLGGVGLIPGMPNMAFLLLAALCGYAAWRLHKQKAAAPVEDKEPQDSKPAELSWDDVTPADALSLEVGYRIVPLVDDKQGGQLLAKIKGIRKKLTSELGFLVPAVHIRDNLELPPNGYRILLQGTPLAAG
ncbi:MAG: FHIPEP family type III secretion protein, partial [Salinisphaeraceae bacterium]|nr:FHIPEP family type III secretion protein [Salinisphaeraceae bacterium]